jgi:sugar phosphate isomerase/epimerase
MKRPIGLAALTVLELDPPDMVVCAARAGYSHIGLRLIPATPTEVSYATIGDTPIVRETLRRLADTGIAVLDIEILRLRPETHVADFEAVLETGARLGAHHVLVAGNDPDETRLTENFAALCDLAEPYGLRPSIEPMPWTDARNLQQAARIVGNARRPNAGVLIEPLHFDRAGNTADDIAHVPADYFRYVQMCDAPAERPTDTAGLLFQARAERLLPGDGKLDLAGILRALPPDLPISVEIPMTRLAQTVNAEERARRALDATRRLLRQVYP